MKKDNRSEREIMLENYLDEAISFLTKIQDKFEYIFLAPSPFKTEEEIKEQIDEFYSLILKSLKITVPYNMHRKNKQH